MPARSAATLRVGWSGDLATNAGSLYVGALADLRIYSRALSTSELVALSQPPIAAYLAAYAYTAALPASPVAGVFYEHIDTIYTAL